MIFGENVGDLVNKRGWIIAVRYLEKLVKKKVAIDFGVFSCSWKKFKESLIRSFVRYLEKLMKKKVN